MDDESGEFVETAELVHRKIRVIDGETGTRLSERSIRELIPETR